MGGENLGVSVVVLQAKSPKSPNPQICAAPAIAASSGWSAAVAGGGKGGGGRGLAAAPGAQVTATGHQSVDSDVAFRLFFSAEFFLWSNIFRSLCYLLCTMQNFVICILKYFRKTCTAAFFLIKNAMVGLIIVGCPFGLKFGHVLSL